MYGNLTRDWRSRLPLPVLPDPGEDDDGYYDDDGDDDDDEARSGRGFRDP